MRTRTIVVFIGTIIGTCTPLTFGDEAARDKGSAATVTKTNGDRLTITNLVASYHAYGPWVVNLPHAESRRLELHLFLKGAPLAERTKSILVEFDDIAWCEFEWSKNEGNNMWSDLKLWKIYCRDDSVIKVSPTNFTKLDRDGKVLQEMRLDSFEVLGGSVMGGVQGGSGGGAGFFSMQLTGFAGQFRPVGKTQEWKHVLLSPQDIRRMEFRHAVGSDTETSTTATPPRSTGLGPQSPGKSLRLDESILPKFSAELQGQNEVRVKNPNDFTVLVGIRSGNMGKDFAVGANRTDSIRIPDCDTTFSLYIAVSQTPCFRGTTSR